MEIEICPPLDVDQARIDLIKIEMFGARGERLTDKELVTRIRELKKISSIHHERKERIQSLLAKTKDCLNETKNCLNEVDPD